MVVAPRSVVARHKLRHAVTFTIAVAAHAITPATAHAQRLEDLAPGVRQFVSVESTSVLIEHVLLNDGTGTPARDAMSVLIRGRSHRGGSPQRPAARAAGICGRRGADAQRVRARGLVERNGAEEKTRLRRTHEPISFFGSWGL